MKESFSNKKPNSVTLKIADDSGEMFEWEVSHQSGDMVYLKHYYDNADDARFIYRGMSRARYGELGGVLSDEYDSSEAEGSDDQSVIYVKDFEEHLKKSREDLKASGDRLRDIQQDIASTLRSHSIDIDEQDPDQPFTNRNARMLLSYADIYGNEQAYSDYMKTPRAIAYTDELINLSSEHGINAVLKLSSDIQKDYKKAASALSFERSSGSVEDSKSWSMWDIAKQSYMAKHPEESNDNYKLADPFDPKHRKNKIREISSRHLGWEFTTAAREAGKKSLEGITEELSDEDISIRQNDASYDFISATISKEATEKIFELIEQYPSKIPSHIYTQIGELLRADGATKSKKKTKK